MCLFHESVILNKYTRNCERQTSKGRGRESLPLSLSTPVLVRGYLNVTECVLFSSELRAVQASSTARDSEDAGGSCSATSASQSTGEDLGGGTKHGVQ